MNKRAGSVLRLATPVRALSQRFALFFLISVAVALMMLGKNDSIVIEKARTAVTDAVAPLLEFASRPVATVNEMVEQGQQLIQLAAENTGLRQRNERLAHWQTVARQLEAENQAMRKMLDMAPEAGIGFVTARVIGDQGGAFVRSVLVNAGTSQGAARGQAAVTGEGLAGRVAEAGGRSARVLLITDMNSRIPILVGGARDRAVLAGDNTGLPLLLYLGPRVEVQVGDRIVTSGHGGVFPPGLPVGQVASVSQEGIRVQPFVDWGHMEYLRLIDYQLPGILHAFQGDEGSGTGR